MASNNKTDIKSQRCPLKVLLRLRPLKQEELKEPTCIEISKASNTIKLIKNKTYYQFNFDRIYEPEATQTELFDDEISAIVDETLKGFNCTIFAYGQTGTGKSFTMQGPPECDYSKINEMSGMIPRAVDRIFSVLNEKNVEYTVTVSHVELYNEQLSDLLSNDESVKLKVQQDVKGFCLITPLEELQVCNINEVLRLLEKGLAKRKTFETKMNSYSSRSHCIFLITVHIKETQLDGTELVKTGKLYLVDLAGSENIGKSEVQGKQKTEAGNINKSLLTLGRVITALTEGSLHVPYRESNLTRILQDSLGGKSKTCIIATISPSSSCFEESKSTLQYASSAKKICNTPEVNEKKTEKSVLLNLHKEISYLKRELDAARFGDKNGGFYITKETFEDNQNRIKTLELELKNKEAELERMQELFSKTQKELEETTIKYEETSIKLDKTQSHLERTEENLVAEKNLVHNLKEIIKVDDQVQSELYNHIEDIHSKLQYCTESISKLHDSHERKGQIFSENQQGNSSFKQEVISDFIPKLCQNTIAFKQTVQNKLQEETFQIDSFLSSLKQTLETNNQTFQTYINQCTQTLQSISAITESNCNQQIESNQTLTTLSENQSGLIGQLTEQLQKQIQQIFVQSSSQIHLFLQGTQQWNVSMKEYLYKQYLSVEEWANAHNAQIQSLYFTFQDYEKQQIQNMNYQKQHLQSLNTNHAEKLANFQQQVQKMLTTFCKELGEETNTEIINVEQSVQKNLEELNSFSSTAQTSVSQLKVNTENHQKASLLSFEDASSQHEQFVQKHQQDLNQIQSSSVASFQSHCQTFTSQLLEAQGNYQSNLEENLKTENKSLEDFSFQIQEHLNSSHTSLAQIQSLVSLNSDQTKSVVEDHSQQMKKNNEEEFKDVTSFSSKIENGLGNIESKFPNWRPYIASGNTPKKQPIPVPSKPSRKRKNSLVSQLKIPMNDLNHLEINGLEGTCNNSYEEPNLTPTTVLTPTYPTNSNSNNSKQVPIHQLTSSQKHLRGTSINNNNPSSAIPSSFSSSSPLSPSSSITFNPQNIRNTKRQKSLRGNSDQNKENLLENNLRQINF